MLPAPSPDRLDALVGLRPDDDDPVRRTATWARRALDDGLLHLPAPGHGDTAARWARLAELGCVDLDLARLGEGHADAQAILDELSATGDGEGLWAVWAADPPGDNGRLRAARTDAEWRLTGVKPWCSGAGCCDRALVTAHADDGYRLFAVDLDGAHVEAVPGGWPTTAMRGSDTRSVRFADAPATAVGDVGAYLSRPGFWHGGVGVAAVWWGGACAVAGALARADVRRPLDPHSLAHAGAVDAALVAARAVLDAAAADIDDDPHDRTGAARLTARRARAAVEAAAGTVLERTGRALGAAPLALDGEHARRVADLTLYLRQSHAERDLEALGRDSLDAGGAPWPDGLACLG